MLIASSGDIQTAYSKLEDLESTMPLFSNEVGGHFVFNQHIRFQLAYRIEQASKLNTAVSKLKLHQTLAEVRQHKIGQHLSKNGRHC